MEFDTIIVGSGASGVAAALELDCLGTAILDVGEVPPRGFAWDTLSDAKRAGDVKALLGSHWEMLANIYRAKRHAKLKAPLLRYVDTGEPYEVINNNGSKVNAGRGSYARGGLANAWGGQVYRYTQADLDALGGWPVGYRELLPFYNKLEKHIGVAGANDLLVHFFGDSPNLLPPAPIVPSARQLLSRYEKNFGRRSAELMLGHPRLALLTTKYRGYEPYRFGETDFFNTLDPSFYTPQRTLNELLARGNITYLSGMRLNKYEEMGDKVELEVLDVKANELVRIKCRNLLLACGTLQTTKLVLSSNVAKNKSLPILEHPPILVPLIFPKMVGRTFPKSSFPIQLAGCFEYQSERQMLSIYYAGGMLRSDLLLDLPFSIQDNLLLLNGILPGFFVLQVWRSALPHPSNRISLNDEGSISVRYPYSTENPGINHLLKELRKLGVFGSQKFVQKYPPGAGFHFAGSLPMRDRPEEFETDAYGRLWNCKHVYVIDGSVLPSLPAKNLTLTIMANACRIAESITKC